ncbi:MAG TPA: hypothetical protein PLR83_00265 [Pyrinomonadaceae bacterium]|nr:hypothetical protein [Pyrinomonadaceae bacterium]
METKNKGMRLVPPATPETHSLVALTFDAEIKRLAVEKGLEIGTVMTKLAGFTGLDERQLYNYRSGKTDIPSLLIPVFCKQFESNALAMAIVSLCDVTPIETDDGFDVARGLRTSRPRNACGRRGLPGRIR